MDRLSIDLNLVRIRRSYRRRREDAKGQYTEDPDSWITLKSNGEHVPLNSAGIAIGGAGGWAKGKNFSSAKSTKKRHNKTSGHKLSKGVGVSPAYKKALKTVEESIRSQKVESAYCIGEDGSVLFSESQGHQSQVAFTPEQVQKMNGANLTHNHPSGRTFSEEDLKILLHANLASIRATSEKTDYELARLDGDFPERENFATDCEAAVNHKAKETDVEYYMAVKELNAGLITEQEFQGVCEKLDNILFQYKEEWLTNNSEGYGFRYTVTRR